ARKRNQYLQREGQTIGRTEAGKRGARAPASRKERATAPGSGGGDASETDFRAGNPGRFGFQAVEAHAAERKRERSIRGNSGQRRGGGRVSCLRNILRSGQQTPQNRKHLRS